MDTDGTAETEDEVLQDCDSESSSVDDHDAEKERAVVALFVCDTVHSVDSEFVLDAEPVELREGVGGGVTVRETDLEYESVSVVELEFDCKDEADSEYETETEYDIDTSFVPLLEVDALPALNERDVEADRDLGGESEKVLEIVVEDVGVDDADKETEFSDVAEADTVLVRDIVSEEESSFDTEDVALQESDVVTSCDAVDVADKLSLVLVV